MLKGHLPTVIYHQVYYYTKRSIPRAVLRLPATDASDQQPNYTLVVHIAMHIRIKGVKLQFHAQCNTRISNFTLLIRKSGQVLERFWHRLATTTMCRLAFIIHGTNRSENGSTLVRL